MKSKITLIGAGSAFAINIVETLDSAVFDNFEFVLNDINSENLNRAEKAVRDVAKKLDLKVKISSDPNLESSLVDASYVIIACERDRYNYWIKDIEIPAKHGVVQATGENGGPGGLIHSMRNINMMMPIVAAIEEMCPDAWVLNLTNPMSVLCTYFRKYSSIKYAGFCHQVHGSVGVMSEQLGFQPGDLEVISGGINHLNWLFDVRKKGSSRSYMDEFVTAIQSSEWWLKKFDNAPEHMFSLEVFKTFGMYPIGYDNHICEYLSFFYEQSEWNNKGVEPLIDSVLRPQVARGRSTMEAQHLMGPDATKYPFPRNANHPHYRESVCPLIHALETNTPLYIDAMVGENKGAISNLPSDAIVDRPVVVTGGQVRSVYVGELPPGPREICRRQIALHEMIVQATVEGDETLAVQALCLDPYVRSLTQARAIWKEFRSEYAECLSSFD